MVETVATLLLADISGFTEFMSSTELTHGSRAVSILENTMLEALPEDYKVLELEGDAVLIMREGPAPSKKEIIDACIKIFNAFHFRRQWLQQHAVCPCNACLEIASLQLKFVAHYGRITELKVGQFTNISGTEVIIAHRLMKNSVPSHEYLLFTDQLFNNTSDLDERDEMDWTPSYDEYATIGKVPYRFTLLDEARKKVPLPPRPNTEYFRDDTSYHEVGLNFNFNDAYMVMMNIPGRAAWVSGLQRVEQDMPDVFIGSIHNCIFDDFECVISPLRMIASGDQLLFAESCRVNGLYLVYEYIFKNVNENESTFAYRLMIPDQSPVPEDLKSSLFNNLQTMTENFKVFCENAKAKV